MHRVEYPEICLVYVSYLDKTKTRKNYWKSYNDLVKVHVFL